MVRWKLLDWQHDVIFPERRLTKAFTITGGGVDSEGKAEKPFEGAMYKLSFQSVASAATQGADSIVFDGDGKPKVDTNATAKEIDVELPDYRVVPVQPGGVHFTYLKVRHHTHHRTAWHEP